MASSALAFLATVRPRRLAMEPPETRMPPASAGNPRSPFIQAVTCISSIVEAIGPPTMFTLRPEASMSASIPEGLPVPTTKPQNRGCLLKLDWFRRSSSTKSL